MQLKSNPHTNLDDDNHYFVASRFFEQLVASLEIDEPFNPKDPLFLPIHTSTKTK